MSISPVAPRRSLYWPELVYTLQPGLQGYTLYLVGGIVRDAYLGYPGYDLDFTTPQDGRTVARKIANLLSGDFYVLDDARQVGRALVFYDHKQWIIDVARMRQDDLLHDLQDRDFTINAMAVDLQQPEYLLDPLNGMDALETRKLVLCSPGAIQNDSVRALRGVRMSIRFKLMMPPETRQAIREHGVALHQASTERIRDEFFKLFEAPRLTTALQILDKLNLLTLILPEIASLQTQSECSAHYPDAWKHSLHAVNMMEKILQVFSPRRTDQDAASFVMGMIALNLAHLRGNIETMLNTSYGGDMRSHRALLLFAALVHEIATDPHTINQIGENLRLSVDEIRRLQQMIQQHQQPEILKQKSELTRRDIYHFWRKPGDAGVDACLLSMANYAGNYILQPAQDDWLAFIELQRTLLEAYYLEQDTLLTFTPLLNGNDLMTYFDLKPGPIIGKALAALHEAQALYEIDSREAALEWATRWLADNR